MSHISRVPLPSIALVLTTDHTRVPRRPSVIKVAALPPFPTKTDNEPLDLMKTIDMRGSEPQLPLVEYDTLQDDIHDQPAAVVEEDDTIDLAESTHEGRFVDVAGSIRTLFKDKISSAVFSFRRLVYVGLPYTCFRNIPRQ